MGCAAGNSRLPVGARLPGDQLTLKLSIRGSPRVAPLRAEDAPVTQDVPRDFEPRTRHGAEATWKLPPAPIERSRSHVRQVLAPTTLPRGPVPAAGHGTHAQSGLSFEHWGSCTRAGALTTCPHGLSGPVPRWCLLVGRGPGAHPIPAS